MLTKSNYLKFVQCHKAFWLETHHPEQAAPPEPSTRRRLRVGQRIDLLARELYPHGELIPYRIHPEEMAPLTAEAIQNDAETLFQATFHVEGSLVKVDILTQEGDGWHLIEVKSSTGYKKEVHLPDIGFQLYVLKKAGVNVVRASIMHLNKPCRFPDLSNLFELRDVTEEAVAYLPTVEQAVARMRSLNSLTTIPTISIGRHCRKPYQCTFYEHCWEGVSDPTIYDIPFLKRPQEAELESQQIQLVADIPRDFVLKDKRAARYVRLIRDKTEDIDKPAIQAELDQLTYPLYFFDFETIDYAVPIFEGCKPYLQVPFQYSCHWLDAEGDAPVHLDYLHREQDDPRRVLVEALLAHIGETGSIIVYFATFERGRLRELAEAFPEYAPRLLGMVDRLWDQLDIFKRYYTDYKFGGSNSLKAVLPVITDLSYEPLDVQNGTQAQVVWEEMIHETDVDRQGQMFEQLRAYCRLDTLAMVEIHKALRRL